MKKNSIDLLFFLPHGFHQTQLNLRWLQHFEQENLIVFLEEIVQEKSFDIHNFKNVLEEYGIGFDPINSAGHV